MNPRLVVCVLSTTVLCAWSGAEIANTSSPDPLTRGVSIYACHHSYFVPVPPILSELAKAGGFPDQNILGTHMIGGSKSIQHWENHDASNMAKAELTAGKVDVLILTPVYLPDDGIEKYAQLGFEHNRNFRVTVMEAWAPFDVCNPTLYDSRYQPQPGEPPMMPKPTKVDRPRPERG